jgi:hypothetical protein
MELGESNASNNIRLEATTTGDSLLNILSWNAYTGWDGGVSEYQIMRKLGSEDFFSLHASVPGGTTSYEEDVEEFMQEEGEFCYKVIAVEAPNQYDSEAMSTSNEACATQEPLMWIPNTIVINGVNDEFKPVAGFIDFETYEMEIISRWGKKIFYTDDINEGWRGREGGEYVKEDYYQYIVSYRDGSGQAYVERGVVYVLRGGAN